MLWLGKAVSTREADDVTYFKVGGYDDPPNSQQPLRTRALWKMLADHVHHPLKVVMDSDPELATLDENQEIGGDEVGDIDFQSYLRDWPG